MHDKRYCIYFDRVCQEYLSRYVTIPVDNVKELQL